MRRVVSREALRLLDMLNDSLCFSVTQIIFKIGDSRNTFERALLAAGVLNIRSYRYVRKRGWPPLYENSTNIKQGSKDFNR